MLSSLNAFGGLSAAELLTLFGVKSSSSSSSATSTSAPQSASTGVSGSTANDPANAIQAILAQAQIDKAQTATSGGGSAISATAQAEYAAKTAAASAASVIEQAALAAQTETAAGASGVSAFLGAAEAAQVVSSAAVISAYAPTDGPEPVSQVYDNWLTANSASLLVVTGSGATDVTMGTADAQAMSYRASEALGSYQYQSQQLAQEAQAPQNPTLAQAQPSNYLQLSLWVNGGGGGYGLDTFVQAEAQQLVAAFENHTLEPTSSNVTEFSYAGVYGFADFAITGIEVSDSTVLGSGMNLVTQDIREYNSGFNELVNESTALSGGYSSYGSALGFAIPLSNS